MGGGETLVTVTKKNLKIMPDVGGCTDFTQKQKMREEVDFVRAYFLNSFN